jgi:hypothetical protein
MPGCWKGSSSSRRARQRGRCRGTTCEDPSAFARARLHSSMRLRRSRCRCGPRNRRGGSAARSRGQGRGENAAPGTAPFSSVYDADGGHGASAHRRSRPCGGARGPRTRLETLVAPHGFASSTLPARRRSRGSSRLRDPRARRGPPPSGTRSSDGVRAVHPPPGRLRAQLPARMRAWARRTLEYLLECMLRVRRCVRVGLPPWALPLTSQPTASLGCVRTPTPPRDGSRGPRACQGA